MHKITLFYASNKLCRESIETTDGNCSEKRRNVRHIANCCTVESKKIRSCGLLDLPSQTKLASKNTTVMRLSLTVLVMRAES